MNNLIIAYSVGTTVDNAVDYWEAFRVDGIRDAHIRYSELSKKENIYSLSMCEVIKSTDYF